ncbi:MAG: hypothetical protein ACT4QF_20765 [Sporichthyaceae bacterium]
MLHALALPTAVEVPNPKPSAPPEIAAKIDLLLGFLRYGVIAACVAGVFLVAGKAALAHRRGELSDVMGHLGAVAAACVLVASGSALVGFLA